MIWYNKSLPILARRYPFVTCVTCTKVVEERNNIVEELNGEFKKKNNVKRQPDYKDLTVFQVKDGNLITIGS